MAEMLHEQRQGLVPAQIEGTNNVAAESNGSSEPVRKFVCGSQPETKEWK